MYHDLGDTIAVQYGGSQLVNTMETYRKINQWTSHSRDMIESFRRYYNNSFLDGQRQEAYNLFLGNYIFTQGQPMLWDLATDYYLHHTDPRTWDRQSQRGYVSWFTMENLEPKQPPQSFPAPRNTFSSGDSQLGLITDDYWLEYYRPTTLSSFPKMFAYKMNSTLKYIPFSSKPTEDTWHDLSPFRIRSDGDRETDRDRTRERCEDHKNHNVDNSRTMIKTKKEVSIFDPHDPVPWKVGRNLASSDRHLLNTNGMVTSQLSRGGLVVSSNTNAAEDKASMLLRSFTKAVYESLNPNVSRQEATDYAQYVAHPQNLPLVVSTAVPTEVDNEYQEYINGAWRLETNASDLHNKVNVDDIADTYANLLKVGDHPLTVTEEDAQKKRYKAYRKWLSGKPLFKQLPIDSDHRDLAHISHDVFRVT
jgi:hypothetical protein